jgi:hypothetical protein
MAYTDSTKIEAYVGSDISSYNGVLSSWISSVKAFIDKYCDTTFEASDEQTRYYAGDGSKVLLIDPATSVTSIQILDTSGDVESTLSAGLGNDYVLEPANETAKTSVVLLVTARIGGWTSRPQGIKIVGDFGASNSVPADIQLAATKLVAQLIKEANQGGKVKSERLGEYQVTFADINEVAEPLGIYSLLDPHRVLSI